MRVFLSYRRGDDEYFAGRLRDRLAVEYGAQSVFFDVDSIPPGADFRKVIRDTVKQSDLVLVLIGSRWQAGRLANRGDFVRLEIQFAIEHSKFVIPVLVNKTPMPSVDELPPELEDLAFLNAVRIRPDPDFHRDVQGLLAGIQRADSEAEAAKQAEEAESRRRAEAAKQAEEAESRRRAEAAKQAEEAESPRRAEAAKQAEEAESRRRAEAAKQAEEAESRRRAEAAKQEGVLGVESLLDTRKALARAARQARNDQQTSVPHAQTGIVLLPDAAVFPKAYAGERGRIRVEIHDARGGQVVSLSADAAGDFFRAIAAGGSVIIELTGGPGEHVGQADITATIERAGRTVAVSTSLPVKANIVSPPPPHIRRRWRR